MVGTIESGKDTAQQLVESAALHVGTIASIATGAVADTVREVGGILTDAVEAVLGVVESAVNHVGRIAVLITVAVAKIVREVGDLATEGFEMVEASRLARGDHRALAGA